MFHFDCLAPLRHSFAQTTLVPEPQPWVVLYPVYGIFPTRQNNPRNSNAFSRSNILACHSNFIWAISFLCCSWEIVRHKSAKHVTPLGQTTARFMSLWYCPCTVKFQLLWSQGQLMVSRWHSEIRLALCSSLKASPPEAQPWFFQSGWPCVASK